MNSFGILPSPSSSRGSSPAPSLNENIPTPQSEALQKLVNQHLNPSDPSNSSSSSETSSVQTIVPTDELILENENEGGLSSVEILNTLSDVSCFLITAVFFYTLGSLLDIGILTIPTGFLLSFATPFGLVGSAISIIMIAVAFAALYGLASFATWCAEIYLQSLSIENDAVFNEANGANGEFQSQLLNLYDIDLRESNESDMTFLRSLFEKMSQEKRDEVISALHKLDLEPLKKEITEYLLTHNEEIPPFATDLNNLISSTSRAHDGLSDQDKEAVIYLMKNWKGEMPDPTQEDQDDNAYTTLKQAQTVANHLGRIDHETTNHKTFFLMELAKIVKNYVPN